MQVSDLSNERDRMELVGPTGLINARGIEYDRNDKNFWVGDFGGNIYKIAGFDFVSPPVTSVEEDQALKGTLSVHPNPASVSALISMDASRVTRSITVEIIDLFGRSVATVYDGTQSEGNVFARRISLDNVASGTYRVVASTRGSVISSTTLIVAH